MPVLSTTPSGADEMLATRHTDSKRHAERVFGSIFCLLWSSYSHFEVFAKKRTNAVDFRDVRAKRLEQ